MMQGTEGIYTKAPPTPRIANPMNIREIVSVHMSAIAPVIMNEPINIIRVLENF